MYFLRRIFCIIAAVGQCSLLIRSCAFLLLLSILSADHLVYACFFILFWKPTETLVVSSFTCCVCSLFFSLIVIDPSSPIYSAFLYSQFPSFATILYLLKSLRNPCTLLCASIISRALSHSFCRVCWLFSHCIITWHSFVTALLFMQVHILDNFIFRYG